jgi:hypothetical protein
MNLLTSLNPADADDYFAKYSELRVEIGGKTALKIQSAPTSGNSQ